ncbi:MAG: polysaccharide pyruvyl transferase family protein [Pseudomonadota bacterium]|nr:polysaccharide pyruvyl transferase family protein [Pseudomonadota bacterium]
MKVGILTFHRCINYGSFWQSHCLAEGLRASGHDAVILDHHSRRVDIAEWRCAFRPTLPHPTPRGDRSGYRRKVRKFFEAFQSLPLSARFPLDAPAAADRCDVVVVGSDEVWNLSHPWYGNVPLFYGEGFHGRLVSYAASFGSQDAALGLDPVWAARLREFETISVRDGSSRAIVEDAIGVRPPLVLDPCLQFPVRVQETQDELIRAPYIAVYGHGFSQEFASQVRRWARRKRLALISIGYRNDWADQQWIDAGPHEFARFVAGAESVVTNFFHGCVFALANTKPFACEESRYRSNKLRGLMATIGGGQRLCIQNAAEASAVAQLGQPLDPAMFDRIEQLRRSSGEYLAGALAIQPES